MATLAPLNTGTLGTSISPSDYNDNMARIRASINSIATTQIADNAITTDKVLDANITLAKLASDINLVLVGSILAYVSETPPTGYLECDGSAISRTTYSELFAIIGTSYGYGNNSTTFTLPD